jgi:biopolymer transport protein TolQ
MERIFEAGYREFTKLRGQKTLDPATVVDGARRAMRATYQREIDDLEAHLAFLASVGSVSPTSACSAPCGASCTPSAASPT